MGKKGRFLSATGDVLRTFHYDEMEDKSTIVTSQVLDPYIEQNKTERDNTSTLERMGDGMQKIASIPLQTVEEWRKELGSDPLSAENRGWLMKRLHDRAFQNLRTRRGTFL